MRNRTLPALLILILISACTTRSYTDFQKPVVSVSILPQRWFIEQLAGDKVIVNVMIPPGASPATYEPSISQLGQLKRSSIYMKMGYLGFELGWMDKIVSVNPSMEVADLSKGIELIEVEEHEKHHSHSHIHRGADPHIWMSARNAELLAKNASETLSRLLPADSAHIAANLEVLIAKLDSLDREIQSLLSGFESRSFMIYHPALAYFARDYHLEQLSIEWEGKTPSPAHLKRLAILGKEEQISTIFVQMEFDSKNAEILSEEIGAEIVRINPLDPEWPDQMVRIASKLKDSM